ncbi:hypothetical protein FBUS_09126 [Fasciolopsis buskii]|uniref:LIM zinc-binding domain-containing protein n=1 Tax=Fasciolopsis buskii TaxID=27845 RepID=A0A8E0RT25_9TREM|nr:hypothetical protein FBUS_09126 [Fasciolopsis buski]
MERVYHRDCFRCRRCDIVLSPDKYNVENEKPCCQPRCIDQVDQKGVEISINLESNSRPHAYTGRNTPSRSHSVVIGSKVREGDEISIFRGDVDKIAKIQRRLEQIQALGAEEVKCFSCGRRVYLAERLQISNRIYHPECLKCDTCGRILNGRSYSIHEGKVYCAVHHREILNRRNFMGICGSQAILDTTMNSSVGSKLNQDSNRLRIPKQNEKPKKIEYVLCPDPPQIQNATPIVQNEDEVSHLKLCIFSAYIRMS